MLVRVEEYLDWLRARVPVDGAVVADDNGLIVSQRDAGPLAAIMAGCVETMVADLHVLFERDAGDDGLDGHVVVRHGGRNLIALWAPTEYGRLYGVLIGKAVLAPEVLELAARGFRAVFAD